MSLLKMGNMLPPAGEIQTHTRKSFNRSAITIVIIVTWCRLNVFTMIGRRHEKNFQFIYFLIIIHLFIYF